MAVNLFHSFPAPAKLNLMLHVVGQRPDGYHLLETVFRFLDYGDTIHIAVRDDARIVLETPLPDVDPESDLTVRAARLLQSVTGSTQGASLRIDKRLPMGGGLGGGSSDAATVLIALNQLWETGLDREVLMALGLRLGADVPVFIFGQPAFASGIGEELTVCEVPDAWYVVLYPGVSIPTQKIFSSKDLTRDSEPLIMRALSVTQRRNDLQPVACKEFPKVAECLNKLSKFGSAMMTGSGSCVFLECHSKLEAETVYQMLSIEYNGFLARGIKQHPLYGSI